MSEPAVRVDGVGGRVRALPVALHDVVVTATPDELRACVKQHVAAYKYPRHVRLVDELPKGPTGKILNRAIRPPAVAED
jgi:acyl-coenzyme A synthetase/AMP-(fatty) acid ligase